MFLFWFIKAVFMMLAAVASMAYHNWFGLLLFAISAAADMAMAGKHIEKLVKEVGNEGH